MLHALSLSLSLTHTHTRTRTRTHNSMPTIILRLYSPFRKFLGKTLRPGIIHILFVATYCELHLYCIQLHVEVRVGEPPSYTHPSFSPLFYQLSIFLSSSSYSLTPRYISLFPSHLHVCISFLPLSLLSRPSLLSLLFFLISSSLF